MIYKIKILSQEHCQDEYEIGSSPILLGRSRSCDVHFSAPDVSGRHIEMRINDAGILEMHILSMRKTTLNNISIPHDSISTLNVNDMIQLGDDVSIKVILCDEQETVISEHIIEDDATVIPNDNTTSSISVLSNEQESETCEKTEVEVAHDDFNAGETIAMQTQMATPEELDFLRKQHGQSNKKKLYVYLLGSLVAIGIIVIGWIFSATNKETNLSWPLDAKGNFNDEVIFPNTEAGRDFLIYFPRYKDMQITKKANHIIAETRIGREQDVELRLEFFASKSINNLYLKREDAFKEWIERVIQKGGKWNFDSISEVQFRGKNNGLPYQTVKYSRSIGKESWFGIATFFKYRDWEFVLLKEIPTKERWRGENLLERESFISVSPAFIESHWECGGKILSAPINNLLVEAQSMLDRTSPAMWPQIYEILVSIMVRSIKDNDIKNFNKAQEMLCLLRKKQNQWLNSQKLEYFNALAKNRFKDAQRIRDNCRFMFSDENDQRFHFIRKDQWE